MAGIDQISRQSIIFKNMWRKSHSDIAEEIIALWKQLNPDMSENDAAQRLTQLVYVAKNENNQVVGIATAFKSHIKQLNNYLYAFRVMIVPAYRIPGLATKLTVMTRDFLEGIHHEESTDRCIGIITLIENEGMKLARREAVFPDSGLTYIGNTANGSHIRVYYFKGALISS